MYTNTNTKIYNNIADAVRIAEDAARFANSTEWIAGRTAWKIAAENGDTRPLEIAEGLADYAIYSADRAAAAAQRGSKRCAKHWRSIARQCAKTAADLNINDIGRKVGGQWFGWNPFA